ncbi:COG4223 family protein [Roseovarius amoyensis]|uniref:COG4223 family protein n=1 Tax=Roseovarius amoyensis TaxID=2211448 RepID=UPI000DBE73E1|nr:hypothetical protein [Roseovarius amoyensis]
MAKETTSSNPSSEGRDPAKTEGGDSPPVEAGAPQTDAPVTEGDDGAEPDATPAEPDDGVNAEPDAAETDITDTETTDETPDSVSDAPPPPAAPEQVVIRKGGFFPLLLGGVVAGAIGLGAGYYLSSEGILPGKADIEALKTETSQGLQAQAERIDALSAQLAATEAPDTSGLEAGQAELRDALGALSARITDTENRLGELADRVEGLSSQSLTEGASDAAVAAYEAELEKLQQAMAAQRAEIAGMIAQAEEKEENAEETAQATMRRAALARILTALDTGSSYASALADLQAAGVTIPDPLTHGAADGVATLADLQARFPDAARAALAAGRAAAVETGETGGATAFLRNVLGVRSLEPREGGDPDAILSRAEAAMRDGRLTDALAEIDALPDAARTELADWATDARSRMAVVAAAQKLSEELN